MALRLTAPGLDSPASLLAAFADPARETIMPITGVNHLTFLTRDLAAMARFLCDGLGATQVYDSGDRPFSIAPERFFVLGGVWIAAMEGEPPPPSYQHVAFTVEADDLPVYEARLWAIGAEVVPSRPRVEGEGESLYVRDFDGRLFELHTGTLNHRLRCYTTS